VLEGEKMIKFRWHRGSLEESLRTSVNITSFDELFYLIQKNLSEVGIEVRKENIDISHYADDHRIPETTHIVTLKNYGVLGWTDGTV
jgi:hypothetical protein